MKNSFAFLGCGDVFVFIIFKTKDNSSKINSKFVSHKSLFFPFKNKKVILYYLRFDELNFVGDGEICQT